MIAALPWLRPVRTKLDTGGWREYGFPTKYWSKWGIDLDVYCGFCGLTRDMLVAGIRPRIWFVEVLLSHAKF